MDTKALRQKVLDLAIRGKLVPQDPNDEPASVLLERIRQQKQQMVKEGKLKAKDIKNDTVIFVGEDNLHYEKFADGTVKCIEDEIPFDLPDGWAWCRVRDVASVKGGKRIPKGMSFSPSKTAHAYIRVTDMKNHSVNTDDLKFISEDVFSQIKSYTISKDDLYVTIAGTIGLTGEVPAELDGMNLTENAAKVTDIQINKTYLCMVLQSEFVQQQFQDKTHQVAMPKLALERILSTLIPICSMEIQSDIVSKFREMDSLINQIENEKEVLAEVVSIAKAKILDLAIRGKLVPQDPNDEPASVLLERIRADKEKLIKAGKIKRNHKESIIFKGEDNSYYEKFDNGAIKCIDEDIPFELPDSWCWCRLGTLFAHNTGKALNSSDTAGTLMTYITTSNLYWDRFELDSLKEMPFTESEIEKCTVTKGDLLVCEGGDIGRSAIWMFDNDIRIQNHIHRLRPYISLSNRFYYYVLYMWKQLGLIGGRGIGLQGFSSKALHNLIVPLPPRSEQLHIVAFVDELNQKLSDIEKSLS